MVVVAPLGRGHGGMKQNQYDSFENRRSDTETGIHFINRDDDTPP